MICGLLRLARFDANASLESAQKGGRKDFVGFPITGGAILLASFMLLAVETHLSPYTCSLQSVYPAVVILALIAIYICSPLVRVLGVD